MSTGRLSLFHPCRRPCRFQSQKGVSDFQETIAKSFCCWVYSRLPVMKARSFILRALLIAVVLAPFALPATARPLGAHSCRVPKAQFRTAPEVIQAPRPTEQLVASIPGHRGPTTRLHRIRGKKINIERGFASAPRCFARTRFLLSAVSLMQQELGSPNPSRGPPSLISL